MALSRKVSSETLDHLPETDPSAMRSRRDLQRVHRVMRTPAILLAAFAQLPVRSAPIRLLELGAGDGTLLLRLAGKWPRRQGNVSPPVHLTLLDRQNLVSTSTLQAYRDLGWQAETLTKDVLDWMQEAPASTWDVIVANLFLHHFSGTELAALIQVIAARGNSFIACEPRRARLPLIGSHLIGLIGANAVTRQDAVLSVHAGFRGRELSAIWPQDVPHWQLTEYAAGLFSHCLLAVRGSE